MPGIVQLTDKARIGTWVSWLPASVPDDVDGDAILNLHEAI